jgi:hypothetical protein
MKRKECSQTEHEATCFTLTGRLDLLAHSCHSAILTKEMSSSSQTPESSSHFRSILDAALSEYKSKTGNDLTNNSLAKELQGCESAEAVLDIIQQEAKAFDQFRDGDKRLMRWVCPSVDVLYTISATLGQGVGMVRTIFDDLR